MRKGQDWSLWWTFYELMNVDYNKIIKYKIIYIANKFIFCIHTDMYILNLSNFLYTLLELLARLQCQCMAKSQTNCIVHRWSFCFSKKEPLWLFTSFFNSDKESYLQIRKSLPLLKMWPSVCAQAHVRIVLARHFQSRCHGRVKCNFFNIAARSYNKVPPLTWHENYDRNYPSRFIICRSCSRWGLCSCETNIFSSYE